MNDRPHFKKVTVQINMNYKSTILYNQTFTSTLALSCSTITRYFRIPHTTTMSLHIPINVNVASSEKTLQVIIKPVHVLYHEASNSWCTVWSSSKICYIHHTLYSQNLCTMIKACWSLNLHSALTFSGSKQKPYLWLPLTWWRWQQSRGLHFPSHRQFLWNVPPITECFYKEVLHYEMFCVRAHTPTKPHVSQMPFSEQLLTDLRDLSSVT
jgi:hypothetical protein